MAIYSVKESNSLIVNASHFEIYLIEEAYKVANLNGAPLTYRDIEKYIVESDLKLLSKTLNLKLTDLGFTYKFRKVTSFGDLINKLRNKVIYFSDRAMAFDWLVGNEDKSFWIEAQKQHVGKLSDDKLISFCKNLSKTVYGD